MSSNSWLRILQTAPIVSALRGRDAPSARLAEVVPVLVATPTSALQVTELVLADLDLVPVVELVRLDPPAVDVGAVERSQIVDVEAVLTLDKQRVVARDGHVVEEHLRVGAAADAHPVGVDREALTRAAAAGADDERRAGLLYLLLDEIGRAS